MMVTRAIYSPPSAAEQAPNTTAPNRQDSAMAWPCFGSNYGKTQPQFGWAGGDPPVPVGTGSVFNTPGDAHRLWLPPSCRTLPCPSCAAELLPLLVSIS